MSPLAEATLAARQRRAGAQATRMSAATEHAAARPSPVFAPSRTRWQALGTSAELLVLGDELRLARARAAVERWLEQVDRACSRFRPDSELSRLNASEGRTVCVSHTLIEATQLALRAARLTDGDVDPTLGEALELAGYDRDWELIAAEPDRARVTPSPTPDIATSASPTSTSPTSTSPTPPSWPPVPQPPPTAPRLRARRRARWAAVRVNPPRGTIALPPGVKLDLGATAKAWAADRAALAAQAASGCGVLVSLGGDVATCGECPPGGWRVHVTDDHRDGPDAPGQTVAISGGGLATSSTFVRRWLYGGRQMHHIIDPATGDPARSPWRTVSVAAADCADANIATTAAIVRGEDAAAWLARAGLPARLVANDGTVIRIGAWPPPDRRSPEPGGRVAEPDRRMAEPDRRSPEAAGPGPYLVGAHPAEPKQVGALAERERQR
jgi:thiamine biosynthesis lipoprotein